MKNIMVDNWFMEEVLADIHDNKTRFSEPYSELLMAIVLWDSVYYPQNSYNWWNCFPSEVQNMLLPLDDSRENGYKHSLYLQYRYKGYSKEEYQWINWKDIPPSESDIVASGALRYMALSATNNCDYLPCTRRQRFLRKLNSKRLIQADLSRLKCMTNLDSQVKSYYIDTWGKLVDFSSLELEMPILTRYIFDYTPDIMTPVDYAFHLRETGPVIAYRNYLTQLEAALETQNFKELDYLLKASKDAIAEVLSLNKKAIGSVEVTIFPRPSILLKLGDIKVSFSPNPVIAVGTTVPNFQKKIQLTFLKNLARFATHEKRLY